MPRRSKAQGQGNTEAVPEAVWSSIADPHPLEPLAPALSRFGGRRLGPPPVFAEFGPATPVAPYRVEYVVPVAFTVSVEEPGYPPCTFDVMIRPGGGPEIRRLTIEPRLGEGGQTPSAIRRLPLTTWLEDAMRRAAFRVVPLADGTATVERAFYLAEPATLGREDLAEEHEARVRAYRRRGKKLTDDFLEEVARVYREADAAGDFPVQAVMTQLSGSRSSAGRWVGEARRREVLGPAPAPRKAGELPREGKEDSDEAPAPPEYRRALSTLADPTAPK